MNTLPSLKERLQPYLPRLTLEWLAEAPGERHRAVEGSLVFADISGFTKLSEKLAKLGTVGAEEMADAITRCFSYLLSVAYDEGGGLVKFGGDALLLLFTADGSEDHVVRAARAAMGMRKLLQTVGKLVTAGGRVNLRMSVGAHTGTFDFFLVGESHRELIATGPGSSRVVEMEGIAEAGEIVVSPEFAARLPNSCLGATKGEGRLLRKAPAGEASSLVWVLPELPDEVIEGSIPVAIRETLRAAIGEPEHRHVSVAFVHFDGTDELLRREAPNVVADALHELVANTQAAVDAYGVCFLASDVDADGGKLILTAGAPRAVGDDEERMLLALRRIIDSDPKIPIRIGVNKGPVFAGDIGPRYRRTYTVMGDAVNLAARVMAKANRGQLLATSSILDASGLGFETVALEPFMVKGKKYPVTAFEVRQTAGAKQVVGEHDLPLVGRAAEIAVIEEALSSARAGHGRMIEIVGPPGIGKTRLLYELRQRADGFEVLTAGCELYQASTAYAPVRALLGAALGIPLDPADADVASLLRERVEASAPELIPWLPLLAIPLDVEVPATPEVDALGEEFRRAKLEWAISDLLSRVFADRSVLLAIEDVHWMDDASAALLSMLCLQIANGPWLVAVTRRDEETGFVAAPGEKSTTLRPAPLAVADGEALLLAATEDAPYRPHEVVVLVERSGGNPLFLKELLSAARAAGGVEELPTSVDAIVTAQIDRLPLSDRRLLRYAAVLGASFTDELIEALLDGEEEMLDRAAWRRLSEFVEPDGPGSHRFRHALMRDAAYEGLPFRRRRELHARVGDTICRRAGADDEDFAELLSMHYFYAQQHEDAWKFSVAAGGRAEAKFAPVQAESFYVRALGAAKHVAGVTALELSDTWEKVGDLRERIGQYDRAAIAFREARKLVADDKVRQAQLLLKQAWIPDRSGRYTEALRWVTRGLRALEGREDVGSRKQRAKLLTFYGVVRQAQGRHDDAIEWLNRAIDEAEAAEEKEALAHAYNSLDWALIEAGREVRPIHSERALELYEELGDLGRQASIWGNSGVFAQWVGNWSESLELFEKAREAKERVGDAVDAALAVSNAGEILSDRGELDLSETMFKEALRVHKAADFLMGVGYATTNLGRVAARKGLFDDAERLYAEAREVFGHVGMESEVLETDARRAELLVLQGRSDEALEIADKALDSIRGEGGALQEPFLLRVRGYALAQKARTAEARAAFIEGVEAGRKRESLYEVAMILDALTRLARSQEQEIDPEVERERRELYERLGVIAVPAVPLNPAAE
ncbi:MAG: tetratricopeptide repeat protein [Actinomycetota bacterium]|nr:tetratricopeptide repeat protein [Actinomycetota bacterium]